MRMHRQGRTDRRTTGRGEEEEEAESEGREEEQRGKGEEQRATGRAATMSATTSRAEEWRMLDFPAWAKQENTVGGTRL